MQEAPHCSRFIRRCGGMKRKAQAVRRRISIRFVIGQQIHHERASLCDQLFPKPFSRPMTEREQAATKINPMQFVSAHLDFQLLSLWLSIKRDSFEATRFGIGKAFRCLKRNNVSDHRVRTAGMSDHPLQKHTQVRLRVHHIVIPRFS